VPGSAARRGDGAGQLGDGVDDDVGPPVDRPWDEPLGAGEGRRPEHAGDHRRDSTIGRDDGKVRDRGPEGGVGLGPAGPHVPRRQTTPGRLGDALRAGRHDDVVASPLGGAG